jgi:hypothetical protein
VFEKNAQNGIKNAISDLKQADRDTYLQFCMNQPGDP